MFECSGNVAEELEVSMMSSDSPTGMVHIKKEEEARLCRTCSPPSDTLVVSPTLQSEYCEPKYIEMGLHSPGSPEQQQYCSSTTQSLGETLLGHIEEGMKEEDLPRRLCLVCGDVASGFHYGVASCEACKAFFKRTIQGNIEYTCPAANDCEINKRRRKACQACRFQKCLRMGMLKEGVRLDRVRGGRQKYRRNPEVPYSVQQHFSINKFPVPLEDNKMLEVLSLCEPEVLNCLHPTNQSNDSNLSPVLNIITMLSDLYDRELVGIIGWAKQIPGFTDLSLNDQMRLLQSTWAEILTLSLAYRSLPHCGKLRFAANFSLDERQARDCNAYDVYQVCVHIVERLERLSVAKEEYFLIKALILANSDVRLDEFGSLKKFRDSILTALTDCVSVIRPNTSTTHMQNLLLCLPALRQANQVIRRFWIGVHREGKILMNKLFVEMLEACIR